ncbi:NUDIX hydrolase [Streptomyces sp. NBC_00160]|nr:NUDIX hydrolase [Streptomyces sp. NBC_00160]
MGSVAGLHGWPGLGPDREGDPTCRPSSSWTVPEYWVLPCGGFEPSDESREAALHREIHEEIAGKADIIRLLHTMESDDERQLFYLARIATGPSKTEPVPSSAPKDATNTHWRRSRLRQKGSTASTSSPKRLPMSSGAPSTPASLGQRLRSSHSTLCTCRRGQG